MRTTTIMNTIIYSIIVLSLSVLIYADYQADENINLLGNNITNASNLFGDNINQDGNRVIDNVSIDTILFKNISVSEYFKGYPIKGSIRSGLLYASDYGICCGTMNVTKNSGLELHYPDFKVRTIDELGNENYCDIPEGDVNVTDNQHSVCYINSSCDMVFISFEDYFTKNIIPINYARVFDTFAIDGEIEGAKGTSPAMVDFEKKSKINVLCSSDSHLSVCSGLDVTEDTFPSINISTGNYVYMNSYVPVEARSSLTDGLFLTHHSSGSFTYTNITGLNLTHCDDGTDLVECTGSGYRQYPIYSRCTGANTKTYQLAPLLSGATFNKLAKCVKATPDYTMPSIEKYANVVHHVYCAKRTDSGWDSNGWVDLREAPPGGAGTPDLSIYLDIYGGNPLQSNWEQGAYNFTNEDSWLLGHADNWDKIDTPDDFTTVTASSQITANEFSGAHNWTDNQHYPTACPSYSAVNGNGDSNTCLDAWIHRDGDAGITGDFTFTGSNINNTGNTTSDIYKMQTGATITSNSSCIILTSPDGSSALAVCDV